MDHKTGDCRIKPDRLLGHLLQPQAQDISLFPMLRVPLWQAVAQAFAVKR